MKKLSFTYEKAHEYVKLLKNDIKPNIGFQLQLKEFESILSPLRPKFQLTLPRVNKLYNNYLRKS